MATVTELMQAWNNMVMNAEPSAFDRGDARRAAAIACRFMGTVNNGGYYSFLRLTCELDAEEVHRALSGLGATVAAAEFGRILTLLGTTLPATTYEERAERLDKAWGDELDQLDVLSTEADTDLKEALERHVAEHVEFYLTHPTNESGSAPPFHGPMQAWNNMVMNPEPSAFDQGDARRAAAIACRFMGTVNDGGYHSFLRKSCDLDAEEVRRALSSLGATVAAAEFRRILTLLGTSLPATTHDERAERLDKAWGDELDQLDVLSTEADADLKEALERHVAEYIEFYLT